MADRCLGQTKDGTSCAAKPLPGSDRCPWHDPAWADRRQEWSKKGGRAKSNARRAKKSLPADIMTDDELLSWLGVAFRAVIGGKMQPNVGTAAASIAKAMVIVRQSSELEARLLELEQRAGVGSQGRSA